MAVFQEAVTGEVAAGHDEFQQGVKRAVPLGWVFKAFPQSHNHVNADLVVQALLQEAHVVAMLEGGRGAGPGQSQGPAEPCFALRAKVFCYPEGLISVWVMLAVKHRG